MLQARHRPAQVRRFHNGYADSVPSIVEAYVTTIRTGAEGQVDEMDLDQALRNIDKKLYVEHVPDRFAFEHEFMIRRASPAEVKIDPETDRIYLIGVGLPGREEAVAIEEDVHDRQGNRIGSETITTTRTVDDAVLVYTEVSWREYYTAADRVREFPPEVRHGLCQYFQIPEHQLVGTFLATPSLTDEQLCGIAIYAAHSSA